MKAKIGEYKVVAKAGEGAFGKVYECLGKSGNRVAIKEVDKSTLNEELFEKLKTEAKICMDLDHHNIVKCHTTLQSSKNFYLVFEYCSGGDLQNYLKAKGTIELKEAVFIMRQLRDAYRYLLQRSIIHRDIKLENILLQSKGSLIVKLSDFGCSKIDPIGETFCGTPKYMALEIIEEKTQYDYKADLWAIGLCFWELVFGYNRFPFSVKTIESLKLDIKKYSGPNLRFPPSPKLPEIFYSFFKSILNIAPELRMDAEQFVHHPIFRYDPDQPSQEDERNKPLIPSRDGFPSKPKDLAPKESDRDSTLSDSSTDPATQKLLDGVASAFSERLLELKLTCSTVVSLKNSIAKVQDDKFFSHANGLCLIVLSKTIIKAENTLTSLNQKKNLYSIEGFDEFMRHPNSYTKFLDDFAKIHETAKQLDQDIYTSLLERCFSDEYLREIKVNIYHKNQTNLQQFYKTTFSQVQGSYKEVFDSSIRPDVERQLKKVLVILRNKVIENLDIFYS